MFTLLSHLPSRWTARRVAATSTLLAVALVCAPLSAAHADEPSVPSITGAVTSGGAPLAEISVAAYDEQGASVTHAWTDKTGAYQLDVPAGGSYRLRFEDNDRQLFRTEFWDDKATLATANQIVVGSADVTGKNVDLARNPQVRGTVTTENLDEIEGVRITPFRLVDGVYMEQGLFWSGVDGRYRVPVEAGGTYKLRFQDGNYRTKWLDDATTESSATPLQVTSNVLGKDVRLSRRAAVTGVVSGPSGPARNTQVVAYQQGTFGWSQVEETSTRPNGAYSLGLEPGEYRIKFDGGSSLVSEYYENSLTVEGSTPVTIGSTGRTINAGLVAQPVIRGTVRSDVDGAPLAGMTVSAAAKTVYGDDWFGTSQVQTAADGTYELAVPPGTYRVGFGGSDYRQEYYSDVTDFEDATSIEIDADGAVVDASLAHNPTISGVVSGADGTSLPGIQVTLDTEIAPDEWRTLYEGRTAADGSYDVTALPGSYRVRFRDDKNGRYATEYYGGSTTSAGAEVFTLATDVGDVDAQLEEQSALTGTVTGPGGAPAVGVKVVAIAANVEGIDSTEVKTTTTTSSSGDYSLALEGGTYRLRFESSTLELRPEFWRDASNFNDAELLEIDGSVLTVADAQLEVGSGVTGTVSVPEGSGRTYVAVYRRDSDGSWNFFEEAQPENGVFDVPLPVGTYRVKYELYPFDAIYHGGSATFGGSTDVTITTGDVQDLGGVTFGAAGAVTNVVPPAVSGTPEVGDVLKVSDGQWGPNSQAVALSRQWLRDGEPITGATGPSYPLVEGDQGARIAVQVKGVQDGLLSRSKTSAPTAPVAGGVVVVPPVVVPPVVVPPVVVPPVVTPPMVVLPPVPPAVPQVVKVMPSIKVSGKGAKKKATLTITVKAPGVRPTGKITIRLGSRKLKTVTLKNGKAKVVYVGDKLVNGKTALSKKIAVR